MLCFMSPGPRYAKVGVRNFFARPPPWRHGAKPWRRLCQGETMKKNKISVQSTNGKNGGRPNKISHHFQKSTRSAWENCTTAISTTCILTSRSRLEKYRNNVSRRTNVSSRSLLGWWNQRLGLELQRLVCIPTRQTCNWPIAAGRRQSRTWTAEQSSELVMSDV